MKNKIDLRVIKTKKALYESLINLLKERTFEEIKVSDICENALINRSTFYSHYGDKYELFSSLINDLKLSLSKELNKNQNFSNTREYYLEMIKIFLDYVYEKKDIYLSIMINNKNSIIMDMVYDVINEDIEKHIEENKRNLENNIPSDIVSSFYLGAVVNIAVEWLKNNKNYSKDKILNYLDMLIPKYL